MSFVIFTFAIIAITTEAVIGIYVIKNLPMNARGVSRIRASLLIMLVATSAWWSYHQVNAIRDAYQGTAVKNIWIGGEDIAHKNACAEIVKQGEQFQGWSVLILGGIVAILVTTKVHRMPYFGWAYLPLGPAAVFLATSLHAGWVLSKRYTYLVAKNNFELPTLSALLDVQSDLFLYSILCVSLFATCFLFFIVLERVEPFEEKKEKC
jgi:hypothetical protein